MPSSAQVGGARLVGVHVLLTIGGEDQRALEQLERIEQRGERARSRRPETGRPRPLAREALEHWPLRPHGHTAEGRGVQRLARDGVALVQRRADRELHVVGHLRERPLCRSVELRAETRERAFDSQGCRFRLDQARRHRDAVCPERAQISR